MQPPQHAAQPGHPPSQLQQQIAPGLATAAACTEAGPPQGRPVQTSMRAPAPALAAPASRQRAWVPDVRGTFAGPAFAVAAAEAARPAAARAASWLPAQGSATHAPLDAGTLASTLRVARGSPAADQRRLWLLDTLSDTVARFGASTPAQSGSTAEVIRSASARIAALQTQVTSHTLHTDTARALDFCVGALTRALMGAGTALQVGEATQLAAAVQIFLTVLLRH